MWEENMPDTRIEFFPRAQMVEKYLRIAKITGDEDRIIDYLNNFLEERRRHLKAAAEMPLDCDNCSDVFCVNICRKGKFLLLESCCGIRSTFFTLSEMKGFLRHEFDN